MGHGFALQCKGGVSAEYDHDHANAHRQVHLLSSTVDPFDCVKQYILPLWTERLENGSLR